MPADTGVSVVPLAVQMLVVVDVRVTARVDVAVAVIATGDPTVADGKERVIVCDPFPTGNVSSGEVTGE